MSGFIHEMKIGDVSIPNNLALGPMAGVTDLPFRLLCKEMGVGLLVSEMVSAKAVIYRNRNTEELLETRPEESPISLQLFGSDPEAMSQAVSMLNDRPFEFYDINMGCPVPKVVNNGEGSALMKDPLLAGRIIEAMAKVSTKPITVKIRAGFHDGERTAAELAHVAEESGAAMVAVHARTRDQFYSGKADWSVIREVKESVKIPVIGNGDITCGADAERMIEETGCDGIMVARAARGNPWIFREIIEYSRTGEDISKPPIPEMAEMMLRHAKSICETKGETVGIHEMRKHAAWYTRGYKHASHFRGKVNHCESYEELEGLVRELLKTYVARDLEP